MDDKLKGTSRFCYSYFTRYYECLRINISVFGKDRGVEMCDFIKEVIDNSECKKSESELNVKMDEYIDKMTDAVNINKGS
jgi:hypothetical protein